MRITHHRHRHSAPLLEPPLRAGPAMPVPGSCRAAGGLPAGQAGLSGAASASGSHGATQPGHHKHPEASLGAGCSGTLVGPTEADSLYQALALSCSSNARTVAASGFQRPSQPIPDPGLVSIAYFVRGTPAPGWPGDACSGVLSWGSPSRSCSGCPARASSGSCRGAARHPASASRRWQRE